jgi:DNA-binding MarR family transcriptional regulator
METIELSTSLRSLVSALHKALRKQMSSVNTYSMTEMETIGHLMRKPVLLPTELAALTRVTTQSMSAILKKMEEQGMIIRRPAKDDKRKWYISLSSAGKKMVEKIRYDKDEWLKDTIEETLSVKEKDLLKKALPILNKLVKTGERK